VLRATDYIVPSIEIIDARVQNPRKIFDTVADNGAAAGLVLGGRPVRRRMSIFGGWGLVLPQWGNRGDRTRGSVLGHPAMAIAWLANKLAPFDVTLEPGHMMLSGSFYPTLVGAKRRHIACRFWPLGGVAVQFV